jgi:hypothetical protein
MVNQLMKTALGRLRIVAFIEGCSYLLFVLYIVLLLQVSFLHRWSVIKMLMAFLASLIPFGTFYADKVLFRQSNS